MAKANTVTSDRGKFLGDTTGNRNFNHNMTEANLGGSGEAHSFNGGEYAGAPTKGNTDLPCDRTTGYDGGHGGGKHKAGGSYKGK